MIKIAKLYFKYGTMGSSKTAQLLITKFNYEEKGMNVWLIKPSTDNRDGKDIIKSRIGLSAKVDSVILPQDHIIDKYKTCNVVIADEAQFFTERQIDDLHTIAFKFDIPVICYGLLTDFTSHLFEGSKRLIEISESVQEIKTVCKCGSKAIINARLNNGKVTRQGEQIQIGGNESYTNMCYKCWDKE